MYSSIVFGTFLLLAFFFAAAAAVLLSVGLSSSYDGDLLSYRVLDELDVSDDDDLDEFDDDDDDDVYDEDEIDEPPL